MTHVCALNTLGKLLCISGNLSPKTCGKTGVGALAHHFKTKRKRFFNIFKILLYLWSYQKPLFCLRKEREKTSQTIFLKLAYKAAYLKSVLKRLTKDFLEAALNIL